MALRINCAFSSLVEVFSGEKIDLVVTRPRNILFHFSGKLIDPVPMIRFDVSLDVGFSLQIECFGVCGFLKVALFGHEFLSEL